MTSIDSFGGGAWFETPRSRTRTPLQAALRRTALSAGKVLGLVTLLGIALAIASSLVTGRAPVATPPSPTAVWLAMRKPIPVYTLTGTDFARQPLDYAATRISPGGGRRDTLTFGDPKGQASWLRLSLYRVGQEPAPVATLTQDLTDLGRDAGVAVSNVAGASALQTRFGPFQATDLRIGTGEAASSCVGFRRDGGDTLRIDGLLCGTAGHPAGRDLIGCVIDRIDLMAAAEDQALRDLFVAAERRRGSSCRPALSAQSGHAKSWLDVNSPAPPLKPLGHKAPRS